MLRSIQRAFADEILRPGAIDPGLFCTPPRGSLANRLAAYASGYPARIEEALRESAPALAHLAGAGAFHALAHRFAASEPQHSFDLGEVAASLAAFLRRDPLGSELPFAADLAELEWRVLRAFHADAGETSLTAADLALIQVDDWDSAVVRLRPGSAVVRSAWPIADLWEARDTPIETIDLALEGRPQSVLVRREGSAVAVDPLEPAEATALLAVLAARPLGDVASRLAADDHDPGAIAAAFTRWMQCGLVTGLVTRF